MKSILVTSNVSLVQSLRLALDAEGIAVAVTNEAMAPIQPMTVEVADDDYDRAMVVLRQLQTTPAGPGHQPRSAVRGGWVILAIIALLVVLVCVSIW